MPQQVCKKTVIIPQCFPRIASQAVIVARAFPRRDMVCGLNSAFFFGKFDQPHLNPYKCYFQTFCGKIFRSSTLPRITQSANHGAFAA